MKYPVSGFRDPHEYDHRHANVSGGWLRAAVFGAMDGLVTNIALIAGIGAAGASPGTIVLTGVAGLVAGAFSMALGELTSVRAYNDQMDAEAKVERAALQRNPVEEQRELAEKFVRMGLEPETAQDAAAQIHLNPEHALRAHLVQELGLDLSQRPSPVTAALSSFVTFSVGAAIPLIPYMIGFPVLWAGLAVGGAGLILAGAITGRFTHQKWWVNALRQLLFGGIAVAATYVIGLALGVDAL